ncbi:hypothetical protein SLS60_007131 [Paraconiothyrium brasiliense]|uniref:SprT-like domain-containing protein n=1 Tax=Paraconiothyrium brasiliense TaxID=300254 RepID=A0ABR3R8H7_9PLEO
MATSDSKIHEANELPKLLYPDFPLEYANQLPDDLDPKNVHKHCVCWNCAPKLWESLFEHSTRFNPLIEGPNGYAWPIDAYRQSCDIRTVLKFIFTHLSTLDNASWSSCEEQALQQFDKSMKELNDLFSGKRHWNQLPDLNALGESLDTLFFQGCLHGTCNYEWVTHDSDGNTEDHYFGCFSKNSKHGYLDRITITALGHPKLQRVYTVPQKRAEHILSTVLHEQVHQLLGYYTCDGSCKDATEAQKKLCSYLSARTIGQFCEVESQGKRHFDQTYVGHGPAFQVTRDVFLAPAGGRITHASLTVAIATCACRKLARANWRTFQPRLVSGSLF